MEEKEQKKDKKIRILALCDSPTAATGFAQVSRNVLRGLAKTGKYEIDVIGINYMGDYYDREQHPYNIYPAQPQGYLDMYGRGRLNNAINGHESQAGLKPSWDIIFTIQDPFVLEGLGLNFPFAEQLRVTSELWKRKLDPEHWFKWVAYWPVDASVKENWVTRSIAMPDFPVAYCNWGKNEILRFDRESFDLTFNLKIREADLQKQAKMRIPSLRERIEVIAHGVDLNSFKPLPEEERDKFRKQYFKGMVKNSTFLVVNISRNQPRKDISRTMAAFAEFKKRVPDSHLYLHMKANDAGGSVEEMARNFGLVIGKDYSVPENFSAGIGFSVDVVNKIYNAADLCVTTTLGEGWGFITTEAMATRTPIIAPNITSILDIFNSYHVPDNLDELDKDGLLRGIPVKAGSTSSEWVCLGIEDNERIRPLTNVEDLVNKMVWVKENPDKVKAIVDRAYEWIQGLSWDKIVNDWDNLIMRAYNQLQEERKKGKEIDNAGRNDPCPCGSGVKFKKCHGSPDAVDRFKDWLGEKREDETQTANEQ